MSDECLTIKDIESVVANAVNWWVSAITDESGETTKQQIQNFQSILSSEVKLGLARTGYVTLQTDLYPEGLLAKAAHQSFIKGSGFPQKSFMDISPREVGVRQNRSRRELLFAVQKNQSSKLSEGKMIVLNQYRDKWLGEKFDEVIGFYTREFYCLDNFSSFKVLYKGYLYSSLEEAYQAGKFLEAAPDRTNCEWQMTN